MERPSIDAYWIAMLPLVASRATCPRRAVGAILTDVDGRLVSTGYNGTAARLPHCTEHHCPGHPDDGGKRETCEALHAEANCVAQAFGSNRAPHTLYCLLTPCFSCAKLLLACGVRRIVAVDVYAHDDAGVRLLKKAGAELWIWDKTTKEKRAHV